MRHIASQHEKPPVCCWYTSIVSPSSISSVVGVSNSFMGCPSNLNLTAAIAKPCGVASITVIKLEIYLSVIDRLSIIFAW